LVRKSQKRKGHLSGKTCAEKKIGPMMSERKSEIREVKGEKSYRALTIQKREYRLMETVPPMGTRIEFRGSRETLGGEILETEGLSSSVYL